MSPAVATLMVVALLPETLASAILRKKAEKLNKQLGEKGKRFVAPSDLEEEVGWESYVSLRCLNCGVVHHADLLLVQKTVLSRPWRLLICELVVSLSCAYLGLLYAVFYMLVSLSLNP